MESAEELTLTDLPDLGMKRKRQHHTRNYWEDATHQGKNSDFTSSHSSVVARVRIDGTVGTTTVTSSTVAAPCLRVTYQQPCSLSTSTIPST